MSTIDFSKIRRLLSGGIFPEYTQLFLLGWNNKLRRDKFGEYGNLLNHGHAGSLQKVYDLNNQYIANSANVGKDIQSFYLNGQYNSINDFINQYNQNIDKINATWEGTDSLKYGDTGWSDYNKMHKSMFASRNAEDGDLGYNESTQDILGSTTWLRRADHYNKAWDELTPEEKALRTHEITLNNGTKVKVGKENDGSLILLSSEPDGQPETNDIDNLENENRESSNSAPKQINNENTPLSDEYSALEYTPELKRRQGMWTDWLPLSGILGNNLVNNANQYNAEVQKRFPLQESPYIQGKVTDAYAIRSARERAAARMQSRAASLHGSNTEINAMIDANAEDRANNLREQNLVDQTNEFNLTSQNLQNISNQNNASDVAVNNYNVQQNAAAFNNRLLAKQKLSAANAAEIASYIGNMTASHGKWLQNERIEDARFTQGLNNYNYQNKLADLYETSGLKKLEPNGTPDISQSNAFARLKNIISGNDAESANYRELTNLPTDDDALVTWLNTQHSNPKETELQNMILKDFDNEYTNAYNGYLRQRTSLARDKALADLQVPGTLTNNGFRFLDNIYGPRVSPLYTNSVPYHRQGSKISRLVDYMEHYRRSQWDVNKENQKAQERIQNKLKRDLGALDRETLILLKQAFK